MKAAVVPAKGARWQIQEQPDPKAGPGQVVIRIHASGICYTDVHQSSGNIPGEFPRVLGHEPVGEIVEVGAEVTTRKAGDRVGVPWVQASCGRCEWCQRAKPLFCLLQKGTSVNMPGGHAERMVAYADATMLIPEGLSYEQAAPIFCAGYTVWSGLRWADPQPGERIAVVGIGGLGHLAVQYAKAAGFYTLAVSHSPDKDGLIRELGADQIVRDGQGLADAGGADIVLGTSNSVDAMADAIKGMRPDGRLVAMGFEAKPLSISPADLIMKRLKVIGSQQNNREYLYEALQIAASGKVRVMCEIFPFDKIQEAYEKVETGKVRFRAVVKLLSLVLVLLNASISCTSPKTRIPDPASQSSPIVAAPPTPTPTPNVSSIGKAYHISGNIDEAAQEGDVCDVSVPFTVPGTLKFSFTPTSASKGNYTYSGPFNANGSGPYEISADGKMLVSGTGCIMGRCATYSHNWIAKPIDPKICGKEK